MRTITISDELYVSLKKHIQAMYEIYSDESRRNWYDADDIARSVAETFGALLDSAQYKRE